VKERHQNLYMFGLSIIHSGVHGKYESASRNDAHII